MSVRTTFGVRSRVPGTQVGVQVNTFGLSKLAAGVNGEALAPILLMAIEPSYVEAVDGWPVRTGASRDSIELLVVEVNPRSARVVLQAGGPKLISDPRNKSGKDYAPFIEFHRHIIQGAIYGRDAEMKQGIRNGVAELIRSLTA